MVSFFRMPVMLVFHQSECYSANTFLSPPRSGDSIMKKVWGTLRRQGKCRGAT